MVNAKEKRVEVEAVLEETLAAHLPPNVLENIRTDVLVTVKGLTKIIIRCTLKEGRDGGRAGLSS